MDALREERDQRPKGHSSGGNIFFEYTSQKGCAEEGKRPTSKRSFDPGECPFRCGSLSSLNASCSGSVFKQLFSSFRVFFSKWVSLIPQRIPLEKCIWKISFLQKSVLSDVGLFPPSAHPSWEMYLKNISPPEECPFGRWFLSSLSASLLRSVFKKYLSSRRVSFSTWVSFLPERIFFEKCIQKISFLQKSDLLDVGLFPPSAHPSWEVY